MRLHRSTVDASWLDALGHVNFLEYLRLADQANERFWLEVGGAMSSVSDPLTFVLVETHARYDRELRLGDDFVIESRLVGYDHRRAHFHHTLLRGAKVVSVIQMLALAFDINQRRATVWPRSLLAAFSAARESLRHEARAGLMPWGLDAGAVE